MNTRTASLSARFLRHAPLTQAWVDGIRHALRAVETRRQLAEMEPRMLADIGVSRAEAQEEANRSPWDLKPVARWR